MDVINNGSKDDFPAIHIGILLHVFNQFIPCLNHFTSETEVGRMGGR